MHFFYSVLIALSNNIDNISVRIAYSIRGIKISISKNLWISVITFAIASCAAFSGNQLSQVFNKNITSIISMVILCLIGLWIIFGDRLKHKKKNSKTDSKSANLLEILENPEKADVDNSKQIDFKEATILGIALSIDNIGGGISAGMIGINPILVGLLSATISFLALWVGNLIANIFNRFNLTKKVNLFAGIILIIIGLKQVLFL